MEDKNNFVFNGPLSIRRDYLNWLKFTVVGLVILASILIGFTIKEYYLYYDLLTQRNILLGTVGQLDELVRKKNKLLAQVEQNYKPNKHDQGKHSKIANMLRQIESSLADGVYLDSFEYTVNKIELTGHSNSTEGLLATVVNFSKLSFIKDHEIEHVARNSKMANHRLSFTLIINL